MCAWWSAPPRGALPTATGDRIATRARRVLGEVDAIARLAAQDAAGTGTEVRIGYAWSALGRHTTALQRRWTSERSGSALIFTQVNTPTAGLVERAADIAVTRRELDRRRFQTALIGAEPRYAALASDHPLTRRRAVRLRDFAGSTVAVDARTGTTTEDLWPAHAAPAATRDAHGVDEWLTLIAAGQAIGLTSQATTWQHPRPGVVYRPVLDAEPVPVWLAWWRDDRSEWIGALVQLASELYASNAGRRRGRAIRSG